MDADGHIRERRADVLRGGPDRGRSENRTQATGEIILSAILQAGSLSIDGRLGGKKMWM
ncbi:MAG: hypothetical protein ACLUIQ_08310 [Dialister invisus]